MTHSFLRFARFLSRSLRRDFFLLRLAFVAFVPSAKFVQVEPYSLDSWNAGGVEVGVDVQVVLVVQVVGTWRHPPSSAVKAAHSLGSKKYGALFAACRRLKGAFSKVRAQRGTTGHDSMQSVWVWVWWSFVTFDSALWCLCVYIYMCV